MLDNTISLSPDTFILFSITLIGSVGSFYLLKKFLPYSYKVNKEIIEIKQGIVINPNYLDDVTKSSLSNQDYVNMFNECKDFTETFNDVMDIYSSLMQKGDMASLYLIKYWYWYIKHPTHYKYFAWDEKTLSTLQSAYENKPQDDPPFFPDDIFIFYILIYFFFNLWLFKDYLYILWINFKYSYICPFVRALS